MQAKSPPFQSQVRLWPLIEPISFWVLVYVATIIQNRDAGQETAVMAGIVMLAEVAIECRPYRSVGFLYEFLYDLKVLLRKVSL